MKLNKRSVSVICAAVLLTGALVSCGAYEFPADKIYTVFPVSDSSSSDEGNNDNNASIDKMASPNGNGDLEEGSRTATTTTAATTTAPATTTSEAETTTTTKATTKKTTTTTQPPETTTTTAPATTQAPEITPPPQTTTPYVAPEATTTTQAPQTTTTTTTTTTAPYVEPPKPVETYDRYYGNEYQEAVLEYVNYERAAVGLPALNLNEDLCKAAEVRVKEIYTTWGHTRPNGESAVQYVMQIMGTNSCKAAENIAEGFDSAWEVMYHQKDPNNEWDYYGFMYTYLDGKGHRDNILDPDFTQIGIAYDPGTECWVQLFYGKV